MSRPSPIAELAIATPTAGDDALATPLSDAPTSKATEKQGDIVQTRLHSASPTWTESKRLFEPERSPDSSMPAPTMKTFGRTDSFDPSMQTNPAAPALKTFGRTDSFDPSMQPRPPPAQTPNPPPTLKTFGRADSFDPSMQAMPPPARRSPPPPTLKTFGRADSFDPTMQAMPPPAVSPTFKASAPSLGRAPSFDITEGVSSVQAPAKEKDTSPLKKQRVQSRLARTQSIVPEHQEDPMQTQEEGQRFDSPDAGLMRDMVIAASNPPSGSSPSKRVRGLPRIQRSNTLTDTKLLYTTLTRRMSSFEYDQHFQWGPMIGEGCFSDTFRVQHAHNGEYFAVKRSKERFRSRKERTEWLREVQMAGTLEKHPHVVEYFRAWQDERHFYVQMELCSGGNLRDRLSSDQAAADLRANDQQFWAMTLQIANGLHHIHTHGMLHCDIKPDNILIDSAGQLKIGDLGHARMQHDWDDNEGDARYLALDLLQGNASPAADVFSFGVMLYEIKTGCQLPGRGDEWHALRTEGAKMPSDCDPRLAQLIEAMAHPCSTQRPSTQMVVQEINLRDLHGLSLTLPH